MVDAPDAPFSELLLALTRIYHRLSSASDRLHGPFGLTTGTRSILLLLHHRGKLTLSEIARDRAVSRQFIQRIATPLLEAELVSLASNPGNQRSPKLELTIKGASEVAEILLREAPLAKTLANTLPNNEIETVLSVLSKADAALQTYIDT